MAVEGVWSVLAVAAALLRLGRGLVEVERLGLEFGRLRLQISVHSRRNHARCVCACAVMCAVVRVRA